MVDQGYLSDFEDMEQEAECDPMSVCSSGDETRSGGSIAAPVTVTPAVMKKPHRQQTTSPADVADAGTTNVLKG